MGQFNTEADRYLTAAERAQSLGRDVQTMAGTDAAALEQAGRAQRGFEQESLDLLQQDFANQRDYDYNQALRFQNFVGTPSASGSGTATVRAPGVSNTASTIGAISAGIGTLANVFGGKKKEGGPINADGKRNIKHPMHGLGWLKGK
jgi:hypothetical protein